MDSKQRATQKFKSNNPNYMIDYYQQNKQKFKEKIECPICGCQYAYSNKNKHYNSKKHLKKYNELSNSSQQASIGNEHV